MDHALSHDDTILSRSKNGLGPGGSGLDPVITPILAALAAVALYNVIEIWIQIVSIFKQLWTGLYFWSLVAVTWGIVIVEIGNIAKYFVPQINWVVYCMLTMTGFCLMIVGHSMLLYSRLHLVVHSRSVLRNILIMIAVGSTVCLVPSQMAAFGENSPNSAFWLPVFEVTERVQMCWFAVQETIISVTYIFATVKMVSISLSVRKKRVLEFLIWTNVVIICLDAIPLVLQFMNWANVQGFAKTVVYSIKVKLEFAMLGQLMAITSTSLGAAGRYEQHLWSGTETDEKHGTLSSHARLDSRGNGGRDSHSNRRKSSAQGADSLEALGDKFAASMFSTLLGTVAGQGAVRRQSVSDNLGPELPLFDRSHEGRSRLDSPSDSGLDVPRAAVSHIPSTRASPSEDLTRSDRARYPQTPLQPRHRPSLHWIGRFRLCRATASWPRNLCQHNCIPITHPLLPRVRTKNRVRGGIR